MSKKHPPTRGIGNVIDDIIDGLGYLVYNFPDMVVLVFKEASFKRFFCWNICLWLYSRNF